MAIGLWGGITGSAVALGPVVGGGIVEGITWEAIFWLNVPIGAVLIPLAYARIRESFGKRPQLDTVGLLLMGGGLLALTWGPVRAPSKGWDDPQVVAALLIGSVLVVAFVLWERAARYPMLPMQYFRQHGFSSANSVVFFLFASLFGALFLIAQLFQTALGYSPLAAGLRILPWTGTPMLVAPIASALADRFGNRPLMTAGVLLQAVGLGWVASAAEPGMKYTDLAVPLIIAGVGIAMRFPTVANEVVASVPPHDAGVASGTNSAIGETGGVFGIAVVAAVFANQGSYASIDQFFEGFGPALWVAAGVAAIGVAAALMAPSLRKQPATTEQSSTQDVVAPAALGADPRLRA